MIERVPTLFQRFARGCGKRQREMLQLLDASTTAGATATFDELHRRLQDFVGESKLLGLEKLAAPGSRLGEIVKHWAMSPDLAAQSPPLRAWIKRLYDLAQLFAGDVPDRSALAELQHLNAELEEALHGGRATAAGGRRVLILDDSPIIREALGSELESRGYVVALADDAAAAFLGLRQFQPEIVLLDLHMPDMTGDEVCRRLRESEHGQQLLIILVSSLPEEELAMLAREAGADGSCSKQAGLEGLLSYLDHVAESQQPTILERFDERSKEHRLRIRDLLSTTDPSSDGHAAETISLCVRDFIAESRVLGLNKLAAVGDSMLRLLDHWTPSLSWHPERLERVVAWADQLFALGHHPSAPDVEQLTGELDFETSHAQPQGTDQVVCAPRRILVLDDSPVIGRAVAAELEAHGYPVTWASTLDEFERRLTDFSPQVILLDVNMPEIQGDVICRQLRKRFAGRGVSIVLMSGLPEEQLASLAVRADADGYLSKQDGLEPIVASVDRMTPRTLFLF